LASGPCFYFESIDLFFLFFVFSTNPFILFANFYKDKIVTINQSQKYCCHNEWRNTAMFVIYCHGGSVTLKGKNSINFGSAIPTINFGFKLSLRTVESKRMITLIQCHHARTDESDCVYIYDKIVNKND